MPAWTAESRCKLLLAVISNTPNKSYDWEQIAAIMGSDYNGNACRQQFQKLRKDFGPGGGTSGENAATVENGNGSTKPSNPRAGKKGDQKEKPEGNKKRKRDTKTKTASNGKKAADDNDDDENHDAVLKKIKTENDA